MTRVIGTNSLSIYFIGLKCTLIEINNMLSGCFGKSLLFIVRARPNPTLKKLCVCVLVFLVTGQGTSGVIGD